MSVSVKDISLDISLRNRLFIGTDSGIQSDGLWVEGKERDVTNMVGMVTFNKQQHLYLQCIVIY